MDWRFLDAKYGPHNGPWGRYVVGSLPLDAVIAAIAAGFVGLARMVLARKILVVNILDYFFAIFSSSSSLGIEFKLYLGSCKASV